MTYLELINAVLVRLREDTITTTKFDSDPFYRLIGALVNDAKDSVEDAWNWSQLRGEDSIAVAQGDKTVTLPDSYDNHYHIESILIDELGTYLPWKSWGWIQDKYKGDAVTAVGQGTPCAYGFAKETTLGAQQIDIYPRADDAYTFTVCRTKHQSQLALSTDRLMVPSLPVYTLATALASRERGEIGGTPVSELFALADRHLSDAITHDSDKFPEELEWHAAGQWHNTNVGTA